MVDFHSICFRRLLFSALGVGAIKSNLIILGAEQNQNRKSRQLSRYFDQYAFTVNLGSIIGIGIIPYLHSVLDPPDYYILYLVAIITLLIAVVLFFIGWRYYLHVPSNEAVIFRCISVLINACRSWYAYKRNRHGANITLSRATSSSSSAGLEESMTARNSIHSLLDFAKQSHGGNFLNRQVQEVKAVRNALLVFILLIPFWLAYNQVK